KGVGGILGSIAVVVGLGSMLGAMLEASGGAQVLAGRLIRRFGEDRAPVAMGLTGLIFGIPVFFDIGIFVLAPLVYVAAIKSKRSILLYCLPLLAGLSMTHAFLPPHPGPVAAAGLLHVELGWVILMGIVCGIPAVLAPWAFSAWIGRRTFVAVPHDMVVAAAEARLATVNVLLMVGAGGVFGAILKASGVAQALSDTFHDVGLPVLVLAYLISVVLRVAQGSATVAIVTTAGIVAPLLTEGHHSQAFVALVI